jgi:hypothetical protein
MPNSILQRPIAHHEFAMETFQRTYVFFHARTKAGQPIMILAFLLTETASRHDADPGLIQQFERIKRIGFLFRLVCCLDRGLGKANAWEEIERAGRIDAGHAGERVEALCHRLGTLRQRSVRRVRLGFPERVACISLARWAHQAIYTDLPADWWTERD